MTTTMTEQAGTTIRIGANGYERDVTLHTVGIYSFVREPNGTLRRQCGRCSGCGYLREYGYIHNGVCFACAGAGVEGKPVADLTAAQRWVARAERAAERRNAKREAERLARVAANDAKAAAWATEHLDLAAALTAVPDGESKSHLVLRDLAVQAQIFGLTDAQGQYAERLLADLRTYAAARHAGEVGDVVTVAGQVTRVGTCDGMYGPSTVVTVSADGLHDVVLFSTAKAARAAQVGDRVSVTGTVKRHEEFDGRPQTTLARVRITGEVSS